ncbi:MAG: diaminopimelate epimerase, partial [Candidatus Freyarchaeota archaeon]
MKKVKFEFVKYQACGNDFILKDERAGISIPDEKRPEAVKKLCDRHFGIGADGVLFVEKSEKADGRMRLFDREYREALMCGNGIRCVADYLYNDLKKDKLLIDTNDGVKEINRVGENLYQVNMGKLRYIMKDVKKIFKGEFPDEESLLEKEMIFPRIGKVKVSIVSTGEPHAVI